MNRTPSQIEQEIKADPELLRLLTARPDLLQKILAAAFVAEQFAAIRDNYLSGTDEGFETMGEFIGFLEVPVSPVTGAPMVNESGTQYLFPLTNPTSGETVYFRFARWLQKRLLASLESETQAPAVPSVTWDDEHAQAKGVTPAELEALPIRTERVN